MRCPLKRRKGEGQWCCSCNISQDKHLRSFLRLKTALTVKTVLERPFIRFLSFYCEREPRVNIILFFTCQQGRPRFRTWPRPLSRCLRRVSLIITPMLPIISLSLVTPARDTLALLPKAFHIAERPVCRPTPIVVRRPVVAFGKPLVPSPQDAVPNRPAHVFLVAVAAFIRVGLGPNITATAVPFRPTPIPLLPFTLRRRTFTTGRPRRPCGRPVRLPAGPSFLPSHLPPAPLARPCFPHNTVSSSRNGATRHFSTRRDATSRHACAI